ncbi:Hypothetical predicted protein [Cloeon dipterum]|uniref:Farnesoic acid O-methyl transferase domain-containing protein n=2 Tax=Cloeon dipterum TaxID=197152 RepID=A0A8S1CK04_9INSE|nr:Hypothetical predicted protein [Cloeon dipterum]
MKVPLFDCFSWTYKYYSCYNYNYYKLQLPLHVCKIVTIYYEFLQNSRLFRVMFGHGHCGHFIGRVEPGCRPEYVSEHYATGRIRYTNFDPSARAPGHGRPKSVTKELHTEDSMDYDFQEVSTTNSTCVLRFKVKVAHDAHVCLSSSEDQDATPIYEIFIGGWDNSKCAIRRDRTKPDRAEAETPDVLSADEFRGFWVSWNSDCKIEVGREGEEEPFLSFTDPEPFEITHYGLRTAWGASGEWEIEQGESRRRRLKML